VFVIPSFTVFEGKLIPIGANSFYFVATCMNMEAEYDAVMNSPSYSTEQIYQANV
jgi:hypothetical protein